MSSKKTPYFRHCQIAIEVSYELLILIQTFFSKEKVISNLYLLLWGSCKIIDKKKHQMQVKTTFNEHNNNLIMKFIKHFFSNYNSYFLIYI